MKVSFGGFAKVLNMRRRLNYLKSATFVFAIQLLGMNYLYVNGN